MIDGSARWASSAAQPAGMVTVSGALDFQGLQFTVNGYSVAGGALNAVGNGVTGGNAAGCVLNIDAGVTTTISSTITSAAGVGLDKLGQGTLILAGANSYAGMTDIQAGALEIRNGTALGAADGLQATGTRVRTGAALALAGGDRGRRRGVVPERRRHRQRWCLAQPVRLQRLGRPNHAGGRKPDQRGCRHAHPGRADRRHRPKSRGRRGGRHHDQWRDRNRGRRADSRRPRHANAQRGEQLHRIDEQCLGDARQQRAPGGPSARRDLPECRLAPGWAGQYGAGVKPFDGSIQQGVSNSGVSPNAGSVQGGLVNTAQASNLSTGSIQQGVSNSGEFSNAGSVQVGWSIRRRHRTFRRVRSSRASATAACSPTPARSRWAGQYGAGIEPFDGFDPAGRQQQRRVLQRRLGPGWAGQYGAGIEPFDGFDPAGRQQQRRVLQRRHGPGWAGQYGAGLKPFDGFDPAERQQQRRVLQRRLGPGWAGQYGAGIEPFDGFDPAGRQQQRRVLQRRLGPGWAGHTAQAIEPFDRFDPAGRQQQRRVFPTPARSRVGWSIRAQASNLSTGSIQQGVSNSGVFSNAGSVLGGLVNTAKASNLPTGSIQKVSGTAVSLKAVARLMVG